ncbi:hypothetical protein LGH82_01055 [Mesorhizobium sp. PAMC28654]|uniref:hypothetical protein n=1 Tax=Mesorhizobium sp. PAMC28654 TaxID=2880934 RepID=UPI001D0AD710|nr:hypothetical protein [Mesorhizobium sp. PAMC28654]UDL90032.1 hypothetical protein LGH82_01055 [Mesorhizobium sp. PAMC28654]
MTDWKGFIGKHMLSRKPSRPSSKSPTVAMMGQTEIDVIYLLNRFQIDHVVKALVAEITDALEDDFSEVDRIRYSFFIDTIRYNLNFDLKEQNKESYGSFLNLLYEKMAREYNYDRDLLFLLWGLVTRKRWVEEESIANWMMEVVEHYFERKNLKIDDVYGNVFKTLSGQNTE